MDLKDAKVLVTGGSSGIGLQTARVLVQAGAKVAICGRSSEALERAAAEVDVLPIQADVSKEDDVVRMVARTVDELGGYNVLVNNAAFGDFAPLVEVDRQRFEDLIATNVTGAMLVGRESAKHFVRENYGNIVNISSTAGTKGFAGGSAYVASKFALAGMTECWRAELRKNNVRVMLVNPSEVQTNFAANAGYQQTLSERKLRADEIAHTIASILTLDDRGFVTEATVWATNPEG